MAQYMKANAQGMAQRGVSKQDSVALVKALIRVSVYHVCWMRGLFPEESFDEHNLKQLGDMSIRMLKKDDRRFDEAGNQLDADGNPMDADSAANATPVWREEATQVQRWVEAGVMDALEQGYLKNMYFGIAEDAAGTELLEEYIYSFKYGDDGVEFEVTAGKGKKGNKYSSQSKKGHPPGTDEVRYQVVRLMRMLVCCCQTLEQVPDERFLFIKLTYHDHTPDEYEPPEFHGVAEEDAIGHFERKPFSMEVGTMDTHHHTVCLRVKSVLDACDDMDQDDPDMAEAGASQQISGMMTGDEDALMDNAQGGGAGGTAAEHLSLPLAPGGSKNPTKGGGGAVAAGAAAPEGHQQHRQPADAAVAEHQLTAGPADPKSRAKASLEMLMDTEMQLADPTTLEYELTLKPFSAEDQQPQMKQQQQQQGLHEAAAAAGAAADCDSQADETCATGDEPAGQQGHGNVTSSQVSGGEAYERVRSYCLTRQQVSYVDALSRFYELPGSQLQLVFDGLLREGMLQPSPQQDTFIVTPTPAAPALNEGATHQCNGKKDAAAAAAAAAGTGSQDPMAGVDDSQGFDAAAGMHPEEAARDTSQLMMDQDQDHHCSHQQQHSDADQVLGRMSVLSMDDGRRGAAAAAAAAGRRKGLLNGSVYGRSTRAGSEVTGQPGGPPAPPTAAGPQLDAPAAEEPSVQLGRDQQCFWFDASQQSNQAGAAPAVSSRQHAAGGLGAAAATGAAAAEKQQQRCTSSRVRKTSYVDRPIYQHAGKQQQNRSSSVVSDVHQTAQKVVAKKPAGGHRANPVRAAAAASSRGGTPTTKGAAAANHNTPARTPAGRGASRLAHMKKAGRQV